MIGIVGGVGPYAGLDLTRNIFDQTIAGSDQEHMDVLLLNLGSKILDRTEYLLGQVDRNPGETIAEVILKLEDAGATCVGIPCNTAHAEKIMSVTERLLKDSNSKVQLVNMIDETIKIIRGRFPKIQRVGVLSTTGTNKFKIYQEKLVKAGLSPFEVDMDLQTKVVHPAIYDPEFGIKAQSNPTTKRARANLEEGLDHLIEKGAEVVIKGCTEISLAMPEQSYKDTPLLDPSILLARALIKSIDPNKLKPFTL